MTEDVITFNAFKGYSEKARKIFKKGKTFYLGYVGQKQIEVLFEPQPNYIKVTARELNKDWGLIYEAIMEGVVVRVERKNYFFYLQKVSNYNKGPNKYLASWQRLSLRKFNECKNINKLLLAAKKLVIEIYPELKPELNTKTTGYCDVWYLSLTYSHYIRPEKRKEMMDRLGKCFREFFAKEDYPIRLMWDR